MALQLNLAADKTAVGVAAPEAYARIVQLLFNTKTGQVQVWVDVHATLQARTDNRSPIAGGVYGGVVGVDMPNIDDNIPGIRAALYTWLKTQPFFEGAVDV